jgi:hypothetical protein
MKITLINKVIQLIKKKSKHNVTKNKNKIDQKLNNRSQQKIVNKY